MMRTRLGTCLAAALVASALCVSETAAQQRASGGAVTSFYDLETKALDGKPGNLAQYRGKVSLVVNVASKCGFTPQYEGLEKLQREMKDKGFNVLGFPSNDFGEQEPGTAQEIATFCKLTYGVTFPMFEKVVTRRGSDQSEVYEFLAKSGHLPQWNCAKYLIDKQGQVVAFFPSDVTPESRLLRDAIAKALAARYSLRVAPCLIESRRSRLARRSLRATMCSEVADVTIDPQLSASAREHEYQKVVEALRQSEQRLKTIVDTEPACVKVISADGRLLDMNRAGLEMIEADALSQVLGLSVVDLVHPIDRGRFLAAHRTASEGRPSTVELRIVGLGGTERWLEMHAVPFDTAA